MLSDLGRRENRGCRFQAATECPSAVHFSRTADRYCGGDSDDPFARFRTSTSRAALLGRSIKPCRSTSCVGRFPLVSRWGAGYSWDWRNDRAFRGFRRMDEKFWYLKNCSLFECLSDEHVRRLESRAKSRSFKRGALVYVPSDQGDCVLLLTSGRVKIFHNTHDGKQAVLAIIDPGELFGEIAIATMEEAQREEYAETMEASTIVLIPADDIKRLASEHPGLSVGITKMMGLSRRRVERRLKSLLFRSNRERLVHLLFDLAEKYGKYT